MKSILFDTANIDAIKKYSSYIPYSGITTNPSILKKEGEVDFLDHLKKIRNLIGYDKEIHVQIVGDNRNKTIEDCEKIINEIGDNTFIKVPINKYGLKLIKELKRKKIKITATAIYTEIQAFLAAEYGCEYLAPYVNRMMNINVDPIELIKRIRKYIDKSNIQTQILAASFKNINQVLNAKYSGCHKLTLSTEVMDILLSHPSIEKAISDFQFDWIENFKRDSLL